MDTDALLEDLRVGGGDLEDHNVSMNSQVNDDATEQDGHTTETSSHNLKKRVRTMTVTLACEACRKRHRKCDGVQPTCSSCARFGGECLWETKRKKRGRVVGFKVTKKNRNNNDNGPPATTKTAAKNNDNNSYRCGRGSSSSSSHVRPTKATAVSSSVTVDVESANEMALQNMALVSRLLSIYNQNVFPSIGVTAPAIADISSLITNAYSPRLDKKKLLMYSILATGARSCGDTVRSDAFYKQSRALLSHYFDDIDPYVAIAHALNAHYLEHFENSDRSKVWVATAARQMEIIIRRLRSQSEQDYQSTLLVPSGSTSSFDTTVIMNRTRGPEPVRSLWDDDEDDATEKQRQPCQNEITLHEQILPAYSFVMSTFTFHSLTSDNVTDPFYVFARLISSQTDTISRYYYTVAEMVNAITESALNPSRVDASLAKVEKLYHGVLLALNENEYLMKRMYLAYLFVLQLIYSVHGRIDEAVALDEPIFATVKTASPSQVDVVLLGLLYCTAQVCSRFAPQRFQEHIAFFRRCTPFVPVAQCILDRLLDLDRRAAPLRAGSPNADFDALAALPYYPIWYSNACSDDFSRLSHTTLPRRFDGLASAFQDPSSSLSPWSSSSPFSFSASSSSSPSHSASAASPSALVLGMQPAIDDDNDDAQAVVGRDLVGGEGPLTITNDPAFLFPNVPSSPALTSSLSGITTNPALAEQLQQQQQHTFVDWFGGDDALIIPELLSTTSSATRDPTSVFFHFE